MNLPEINVAIEQLLNDHKDDNIHSLMFYLKKRKELIIEIESKPTKLYIEAKIYAGEGDILRPVWEGKTTEQGIKMRLTKERCNNQRNAVAFIHPYTTKYGDKAGYDFETYELKPW